jgi:nucleotide-binding universal stress UspA family protein
MTDCKQLRILFCCDGSRRAEKAVRFGMRIAAACQAKSSILGIAEKSADEVGLIKALQRVDDIFKQQDLETELITKVGRPVPEIVKHTNEIHYDLAVLGASRKSASWRMSDPVWMSVKVYDIIESIEPPVLAVTDAPPGLNRILICSGGNERIDKAIEFAGVIAHAVDASVNLIHVMPAVPAMYSDLVRFEETTNRVLESKSRLGRTLRRQKDLLEQNGVLGDILVRRGDVVPEVLKELRRVEYDLVVSGSLPAQEKLRKYVMGDVAREIVNRAGIPVMVARTSQKIRLVKVLTGLFNRIFRNPEKPSHGQAADSITINREISTTLERGSRTNVI